MTSHDGCGVAPDAVRRVLQRDRPGSSEARLRLLTCLADCAWESAQGHGLSGITWTWAPFAPVGRAAARTPAGVSRLRLSRRERGHLLVVSSRYGHLPLEELADAARRAVEAADAPRLTTPAGWVAVDMRAT